MAVSSTLVTKSANLEVYTVGATADADSNVSIAHGLGVVPLVWFEWTCTTCRLSLWVNTVRNATTVTLNKTNIAGTGSPNQVLLVYIAVPPLVTR